MEVKEIPVDMISTGIHDVRDDYDDDDMPGLIVSIRNLGILNPITVKEEDGRYIVVAGHRRTYAAKKAQLKTIPCIIRTGDQQDTKEVVFAENIFRRDLSPLEMANGLYDLIVRDKMTLEQTAKCVNKSVGWVKLQLTVLEWPNDCKDVLHEKQLSFSAIHNLAQIKDESYRLYLIRNAVENGATARTTAAWLQAWQSQLPVEDAIQQEPIDISNDNRPIVPKAPCFVCDEVNENQGLAMVMVCPSCVNSIRRMKARQSNG